MNPAISECRSISLINCSVFFLSPKRPPTRAFFFHARAQGFFQFRLDLRSLLIPLQHRKSFNDLDIPNHRSVTKTALFFLALLFCSLVSNGLASQEITGRKNLFVTVYGPEEGLRQSMVSQVHQDSRGLLWLVSGDGLHCFDGNRFTAFRIPFKGVYNNNDNMMRRMVETSPGKFTIASSSSLFSFNSCSGRFNFMLREVSVYFALLNITIEGRTLLWTLSRKFFLSGEDDISPVNLRFTDDLKPPVNFVPIQGMNTGVNDFIILGKDGIITTHLMQEGRETVYQSRWFSIPECRAITRDHEGRIYLLTGEGLYIFFKNGQRQKLFTLKQGHTGGFLADSKQNIWFSDVENKKLYLYKDRELRAVSLTVQTGKYTDTLNCSIKHIFEDKEHNLWFGTDGLGLLKYDPSRIVFSRAETGFTRCLTSFGNDIIAGTYHNGLYRLSADLSSISRIKPELFGNDDYILDLATDPYHHLWIVSRKGLVVLDKDMDIVFRKAFDNLNSGFIFQTDSTLCLQSDTSLYVFSARNKPALISRQSFIAVNSMLWHKGIRWTGTPIGLNYKKCWPGEMFPGTNIGGKWISSSEVYNLRVIGSEIWAATGNGIQVFTSQGVPLNIYPALAELKNETIYELLTDELGRTWYSGIQGIGYLSPDRNKLVKFTVNNNMQAYEYNQKAACTGQEGWLYFGGINGVNGINPDLPVNNLVSAEVKLFSLIVSDTAYTKGIPDESPELVISRKMPHIGGSVFTTDYPDPKNRAFSFLLEGYQQNWTKPVSDPSFTYRNLPPGHYRLLVIYSNPSKVSGNPIELLRFEIKPAFWQTIWFLMLMLILVVSITIYVVKRIQAIRFSNRIRALEQEHALEKERLRISQDMHDEIGASLTRISILSELAMKESSNYTDTSGTVSKIAEISGNAVDELSEIIWAMNPKNDSLDSFVAYVRRYTYTYLEETGIVVQFHFPDEIPSVPMSSELRRNLFLTLKEGLHNIVKHAAASCVTLSLKVTNKSPELTLKDNGHGFDPDAAGKSGNGLTNMKKRIEACGGTYKLISSPGNGTTICFSVSL